MARIPFRIPGATLCLAGLLLCLFPAGARSQRLQYAGANQTFVDSRGDTIPTNPDNLPFKVLNGFPEYRVGPGDILEITTVEAGVRNQESARILPDGTVSFSVLNNIPVADLSLSEVARKLTAELGRYVRLPQVKVLVQEYLSKTASVLGAINIQTATLAGARTGPGVYPLKGRITALDLILEAGGPTADARLDQVRLIRANRTFIIDLQRAITAGDNSQNPIMEHGDVMQVTSITQADRRVAVLGEVSIPGVFNLSSKANMLEAIAASRGFTQDAAANRIRVIRTKDPINPEIFTVSAERILAGDLSQNLALSDGDIIVVPRDYLADLNDLLGVLQPILAWGGLVQTDPAVRLGGYEYNTGGGETGVVPSTTTGGLLQQPISTQQQVIQQVQQNLQRPPADR